jgi:hypothetical protein
MDSLLYLELTEISAHIAACLAPTSFCIEDACLQLLDGGQGVIGGANDAVGASTGDNETAPGGMDALKKTNETDAAAATCYGPHVAVPPTAVASAPSPPSQARPLSAAAPIGVGRYDGGGHVMSCMGEVLEGQIWHAKLLSIETGR